MNYQNINTSEIKTYPEIRRASPSVSYPRAGTEMLGSEWRLVVGTSKPAYNPVTEGVREIAPVDYVQTWEVYTLPQAEQDENILKEAQQEENEAWAEYLQAEAEAKREDWIVAGKPAYTS